MGVGSWCGVVERVEGTLKGRVVMVWGRVVVVVVVVVCVCRC